MESPSNSGTPEDSCAVFYLDGEPCGPRTELWSGYVENNDEVSFVGGMSLWIRCSHKKWGDEKLIVVLHKRTGNGNWTNFQSIYHCFVEDLRVNPSETKNVSYVIEVASANGTVIARTPVLKPYTERWFREKLKKTKLNQLKKAVIGKYASDTFTANNKISDLASENDKLKQDLERLTKELSIMKLENQRLQSQNQSWENFFANVASVLPQIKEYMSPLDAHAMSSPDSNTIVQSDSSSSTSPFDPTLLNIDWTDTSVVLQTFGEHEAPQIEEQTSKRIRPGKPITKAPLIDFDQNKEEDDEDEEADYGNGAHHESAAEAPSEFGDFQSFSSPETDSSPFEAKLEDFPSQESAPTTVLADLAPPTPIRDQYANLQSVNNNLFFSKASAFDDMYGSVAPASKMEMDADFLGFGSVAPNIPNPPPEPQHQQYHKGTSSVALGSLDPFMGAPSPQFHHVSPPPPPPPAKPIVQTFHLDPKLYESFSAPSTPLPPSPMAVPVSPKMYHPQPPSPRGAPLASSSSNSFSTSATAVSAPTAPPSMTFPSHTGSALAIPPRAQSSTLGGPSHSFPSSPGSPSPARGGGGPGVATKRTLAVGLPFTPYTIPPPDAAPKVPARAMAFAPKKTMGTPDKPNPQQPVFQLPTSLPQRNFNNKGVVPNPKPTSQVNVKKESEEPKPLGALLKDSKQSSVEADAEKLKKKKSMSLFSSEPRTSVINPSSTPMPNAKLAQSTTTTERKRLGSANAKEGGPEKEEEEKTENQARLSRRSSASSDGSSAEAKQSFELNRSQSPVSTKTATTTLSTVHSADKKLKEQVSKKQAKKSIDNSRAEAKSGDSSSGTSSGGGSWSFSNALSFFRRSDSKKDQNLVVAKPIPSPVLEGEAKILEDQAKNGSSRQKSKDKIDSKEKAESKAREKKEEKAQVQAKESEESRKRDESSRKEEKWGSRGNAMEELEQALGGMSLKQSKNIIPIPLKLQIYFKLLSQFHSQKWTPKTSNKYEKEEQIGLLIKNNSIAPLLFQIHCCNKAGQIECLEFSNGSLKSLHAELPSKHHRIVVVPNTLKIFQTEGPFLIKLLATGNENESCLLQHVIHLPVPDRKPVSGELASAVSKNEAETVLAASKDTYFTEVGKALSTTKWRDLVRSTEASAGFVFSTETEWICSQCTLRNAVELSKCTACSTQKQEIKPVADENEGTKPLVSWDII